MNKSYFCSERVRLRAMEPEDLEVMYAMENDSPDLGCDELHRTLFQICLETIY